MHQRLQPFISGGLGAIRQDGVVHAIDTEYEFRKTSVTVPLAAGIRILLPGGITVAPEARYQTASFRVRRFPPEQGEWTYHRSITRVSLALGYAW
jgi:hypothetical protein